MSETARGILIANKLVDLIDTLPSPQYPFTARRSRLPRIVKEELPADSADVTVAPLTKAGDEQDRGSEILLYGVSVGVTAWVGDADSATADLVENLVEQIQDFVSLTDNRTLVLEADSSELHHEAELELPFDNDPMYRLQIMREQNIYQSITIFNYIVEIRRT